MAGATAVGRGGAGYSGTPLARKLGIVEGASVVLLEGVRGHRVWAGLRFVLLEKDRPRR